MRRDYQGGFVFTLELRLLLLELFHGFAHGDAEQRFSNANPNDGFPYWLPNNWLPNYWAYDPWRVHLSQ